MHSEDIKRAREMGWKPNNDPYSKKPKPIEIKLTPEEEMLENEELQKQYEMMSRLADQEYQEGY